jgi:hypothetical protein
MLPDPEAEAEVELEDAPIPAPPALPEAEAEVGIVVTEAVSEPDMLPSETLTLEAEPDAVEPVGEPA